MDRQRPKRERLEETNPSSSPPTESSASSSSDEARENVDTSQCMPYYIPSLLSSTANFPLTNTDYLLLSIANQRARNILPHPLYTNAGSLPFLPDNPLHPILGLGSVYTANPYASLSPLAVYQQQPMQLLIHPTHPYLSSQILPGHFQGLPLAATALPASYPQAVTRFADATLPVAPEETFHLEEDVQSIPAVTASNHNEASSESMKSESLVKPKRPLSAYNLFFRAERQQLIQSDDGYNDSDERKRKRSGISFEDLAKEISERWRQIDAKTLQHYNDLARADKERYVREMDRYKEQQDSEMTKRRMDLESTVPEATMELYMKAQAKKPKKRKKSKN